MIAERQPSKVDNEVVVDDGLFAGLSFPSVPTSAIVLNNKQEQSKTDAKENKEGISIEMKEYTSNVSSIVEDNNVVVQNQQVDKPKFGNLSTLYATEVITSESTSLYPELPSIIHNSGNRNTFQGKTYVSVTAHDDDVDTSESTSLLGKSSQKSHTLPQVQQYQPYNKVNGATNNNTASATEDSGLLSDLILENSRLHEEVMNLRTILSEQQSQSQSQQSGYFNIGTKPKQSTTTIPLTNAPKNAPISNQVMMQHTGNYIQNNVLISQNQQQQAINMSTTTTTANTSVTSTAVGGLVADNSAPSQGIKINDTSVPPKQGVKYVCCGGCRQWLLAPKESVYVVCTSCDAINNCNLAPSKSGVESETRAMQQQPRRQVSNWPWFLDCFSRSFN